METANVKCLREIYHSTRMLSSKYLKGQPVLFDDLRVHPMRNKEGELNWFEIGPGTKALRLPDEPGRLRFIKVSEKGGSIAEHEHPDCYEYLFLETGRILVNGFVMDPQEGHVYMEFEPGDSHRIDAPEASKYIVIFSPKPLSFEY